MCSNSRTFFNFVQLSIYVQCPSQREENSKAKAARERILPIIIIWLCVFVLLMAGCVCVRVYNCLCVKGTVQPDWICMRVVPLESPLKGHQPLYVFDFLISVLNI
jgi:hypothetical protein